MAQLSLKSRQIFHDAGAFDKGIQEVVQELRDGAAAYRRYLAAKAKDSKVKPTGSDTEVMETSTEFLFHADGSSRLSDETMPGEMEKLADKLANPRADLSTAERQALNFGGYQAEEKWTQFAALCLKLEELANKQLHHQPLSDADNYFYYDFGRTLASFMGYDSNEFNDVHDDAPRIADIYSDPQTGQVMEVGIGRPLLLYLLYPYGGKLILAHGAVLPYYEFASGERLNDQSWADVLKTPAAPTPPDWLKDVTSKPKSAGR